MKKVSKVFVVVLAMILTLAMGISAFAADDVRAVNKFGKVTYDKTMYTNDTTDGEYDIVFNYQYKTVEAPKMLVTSSNRSILRIVKIENKVINETGTVKTGAVTVTVKALSDGKATITVADRSNTKKSKKVNVTVKTLQASVALSGTNVTQVADKNGLPAYEVTVDAKGKTSFAASVLGATSKKLSYTAVGDAKRIATITAKGAVTAKSTPGKAEYVINATDTRAKQPVGYVTVVVNQVGNKNKPEVAKESKKLTLKSNLAAENHTGVITVTNYDAKDLTFTSNKPAVAVVDATGKVTAKANGKATITVASKANSKLSAKVSVTVTTDVELVTTAFKSASIVADGKSTLALLGTTNKGASNAKVTYEFGVERVGGIEWNKKLSGVSINSKGVLKVKSTKSLPANKVFFVKVIAKDTKNGEYYQTVTITAIDSAKAKTVKIVDSNKTDYSKKTFLATITDNNTKEYELKAEASVDAVALDCGFTWKNSKSAVAEIKTADNGKTVIITPKTVGTTKLTATATDGSKKKTTVTIKVEKAINASKVIQVYKGEKVTLPQSSYTLVDSKSKVVKVSKNVLTGVKVGTTQIKDANGIVYDVYVGPKAADVQKKLNTILTNTIKAENRDWMGASVAFNNKTNAIDITVLNPNADAKDLEYTGATSYLPYFLAEANKHENEYVPKAITVELNKDADPDTDVIMSAAIDGKTFTATTHDLDVNKKVKVSATVDDNGVIHVTENETAYPADTSWTITGVDVAGLKDDLSSKEYEAFVKVLENAADYVNGATVSKDGAEPYVYAKEGDKLVVRQGTREVFSEVITDGTANRAAEAVKKDAVPSISIDSEIDTDTTLRAWIGQNAKITFTMESKSVDYTFVYDVKSTTKDATYDSIVDADVQTVLNIAASEGFDTVAGIASITDCYDPSKNTFEVVAVESKDIATAYTAMKEKFDTVIDAVNETEASRTFDELQKITASVALKDKTTKEVRRENYEMVKDANQSGNAFMKEFADSVFGIIASKADTTAEMDGVVAGFYATFNVGTKSYTQYYEVRFVTNSDVQKAEFDKDLDAKVAAAITEASKDAALASVGTVAYDAATNTVTATFNNDGTLESYKNSAMFETLKKAVLSAVSKETVTGAKLVVGSKSLDIKLGSAETMAKQVYEFLAQEGSKVSALSNKDITFTVNFETSKKEAFAIDYPITVAVNAAEAKDVEAVEEVETTVEEVETIDDVIEEVVDTPEAEVEETEAVEEIDAVDFTEDVIEIEEIVDTEEVEEELIEDAE